MPESGLNVGMDNIANAQPGQSAWAHPTGGAWSHAREAYLKSCLEWQQEVARFLGARVNANISAQQSLTACRSWADAGKLQQEWAAATMKDYLDESSRLLDIATRCAQGMCGTAQTTATAEALVAQTKAA